MTNENVNPESSVSEKAKPVFKRLKAVTIPFYGTSHLKAGESIFVKLTGKMKPSDYQPAKKRGRSVAEENQMIDVPAINLETGEEVNLICSSVLNIKLTEMENAGTDYVGLAFEIQSNGMKGRADQEYQDLSIWIIEA